MEIFNWSDNIPPIDTWVWARYREEPWMLVKTCKRGCCVSDKLGTIMLPRQWYMASPDEKEKVEKSFDQLKSINIFDLY